MNKQLCRIDSPIRPMSVIIVLLSGVLAIVSGSPAIAQQYLEEAHRNGYMMKVNNRFNANVAWNTYRLTPDKLEELYEHIIAIRELTANNDNGEDDADGNADTSGDRYAIFVSLAPLERTK